MNLSFRETYQVGNSPLHRLDVRVKLIMILALIVGIVLTPERAWPAYPLIWALVSSLGLVGGISPIRLAKLGTIALPFTLSAVTLIFTLPGEPVATFLGVEISDAGLARFSSIVLKSWLSVQIALLLSSTTHVSDLIWGLGSLGVPRTLVAIIGFMYRYLFTIRDEAQPLMRARAARSATTPEPSPRGNLLWNAKVTGGMIGNLFLRSYVRSERVYAAMLARGYNGQYHQLAPPALTVQAVLYGFVPIALLIVIEMLAIVRWN